MYLSGAAEDVRGRLTNNLLILFVDLLRVFGHDQKLHRWKRADIHFSQSLTENVRTDKINWTKITYAFGGIVGNGVFVCGGGDEVANSRGTRHLDLTT